MCTRLQRIACVLFFFVLGCANILGQALGQVGTDAANESRYIGVRVDKGTQQKRRPVALALSADNGALLIANRASGTVSLLSTETHSVSEWPVGVAISDLVHWRENLFLCCDHEASELVCLRLVDGELDIVWRRGCVQYPERLKVSGDGESCWVGGLWSRRVERVELSSVGGDQAGLDARRDILDLSFSVGFLCLLDTGSMLVLDAFGDRFAVVSADGTRVINESHLSSRRTGGVFRVPGSSQLLLTQQLLNELAHSVRNDVHWGLMIANSLRVVESSRFQASPFRQLSDLPGMPLGGAGDAKGDPGAVVATQSGSLVVALEGVNQVALGDLGGGGFAYVDVGARPKALAVDDVRNRAYVANYLDDTLSIVDIDTMRTSATVALGETWEGRSLADVGERFFFDARVSHDGWMSCHSCHVNGHSSDFLNDNLSDQSFGAPKRVLSLLGTAKNAPFAWNGSALSLEEQIQNSIEKTMQSADTPAAEMVSAIAAYLHSLPPAPSLSSAREVQIGAELAGKAIFDELKCADCHQGTALTSPLTYSVGIVDEMGGELFNPPSLVGVSQRNRLFHDGRARTLNEVVGTFRHQIDRVLTDEEEAFLLAYLQSL